MQMEVEELFRRITGEKAEEIVRYLQESDGQGYRRVLGVLAQRRKMRPVYWERKPRAERNRWIVEELRKRRNADLAVELLQNWVLGARTQMVLDFLERMGIEHDGQGLVEELPPEPGEGLLREAVEELLGKYAAEDVAVYLNLFVVGESERWPVLARMVREDGRLRLAAGEAVGGEEKGRGDGAAGEAVAASGVGEEKHL